jgi:hypothetical protein
VTPGLYDLVIAGGTVVWTAGDQVYTPAGEPVRAT